MRARINIQLKRVALLRLAAAARRQWLADKIAGHQLHESTNSPKILEVASSLFSSFSSLPSDFQTIWLTAERSSGHLT